MERSRAHASRDDLRAAGVLRRIRRAALFGAFVLYLSLLNGSQEFLSFQWDILLLETGLLAVFLGYSRVIVWMFRWLLFRLMFLSGAVKLLSGDPTWSSLNASRCTIRRSRSRRLSRGTHTSCRVGSGASTRDGVLRRVLLPICVLGPTESAAVCAPWLIGLQILILLTGNYAFFNWLDSRALSLSCSTTVAAPISAQSSLKPSGRTGASVAWSMTILIALLSVSLFMQSITGSLPLATRGLVGLAMPFGLTSSYGLFAKHDDQTARDRGRRIE